MAFLYSLVLIAIVGVSVEANVFTSRIVGGENASPGDAFVFRVLSVEREDMIMANISSGVAISENFGLIVAHAVDGFQMWYIGYGSINVDEHVFQSIDTSNIIRHPEYQTKTLENNIAVIKFTNPVNHHLPIATNRPIVTLIIAFGYGFTDETTQVIPDILQFSAVLVQPNGNECNSYYTEFDSATSLCGIIPSTSFFSDGDQGGAITDLTRTVVHGLISYWGKGPESPVVMVNIPSYLDFIEESKNRLSSR